MNCAVDHSAGCKKWDTCAPEALLTALGGRLTDMQGEDYQYHSTVQHQNSQGVLATAPGQASYSTLLLSLYVIPRTTPGTWPPCPSR